MFAHKLQQSGHLKCPVFSVQPPGRVAWYSPEGFNSEALPLKIDGWKTHMTHAFLGVSAYLARGYVSVDQRFFMWVKW